MTIIFVKKRYSVIYILKKNRSCLCRRGEDVLCNPFAFVYCSVASWGCTRMHLLLMNPKPAETSIHDCHCRADVALCRQKINNDHTSECLGNGVLIFVVSYHF